MKWRRTVGGILDLPILILLYWLGYYNAFFIVLVLMLLSSWIVVKKTTNLEEELGVEEYD